jgi:hypothetical protein
MPNSDLPTVDDRSVWRLSATEADLAVLDSLTAQQKWDGPLVVSMPRTGSTLLGTLFLLLRDADGQHVFDRYVHEPVAPVFWQDEPVSSIPDFVGHLSPGDIIQESAYQFGSKEIARWFLRNARQPVAFVMRHPQLAWPSRWRIMLREWLATHPDSPDAGRWRAAFEGNDFTEIGDILTTKVTQPDNGSYSFLSLINLCRDEGIDFVIVDNAGFRADPDEILAEMCSRWGHQYDDAMTTWEDLAEAKPRVAMSELAAGPEYEWYYARTLESTNGIIRTDREPVPLNRFPAILRGESTDHLTIDTAVEWYELLLALPQTLR